MKIEEPGGAAEPLPEQVRSSSRRYGNKVCIFTETYFPEIGGGERQAQSLAEELTARGFQVFVLTRRSRRSLKDSDQVNGVKVYRLPPSSSSHIKKWGLLLTSLPALIQLRRQYDLIFVSGFRILGITAVIAGKLLGKPCILKADSLGELSGDYFINGLEKLGQSTTSFFFRTFLYFRNRILNRADAFVAISSAMATEFEKTGVNPALTKLVPNSVDTDRFKPVYLDEKRDLRKKLGLPLEDVLVIYTGRLVSYKGLPLLLRVWRQIKEKYRQVSLLLVGEGGLDIHNCEAELRAYAKAYNLRESVCFTGSVQNVHEYLQASDIFVLPTENEAFGISLIEAMASGLPCISTEVGGVKDILEPQQNGIVVSPGDFLQLFDALDRLITNPVFGACLGRAARQTVLDRYSTEPVTQKYINLFVQKLSENSN